MTERSFVGGFLELFSEIGVEVAGVNTALGCAVRLLERLPDLKGKTCDPAHGGQQPNEYPLGGRRL